MAYRIDVYIGSDNGSRQINETYLGKVRQWANVNFPDGYTLLRGEGYYGGASEESIVVDVLSSGELGLTTQLQQLKQTLSQEAILVANIPGFGGHLASDAEEISKPGFPISNWEISGLL
jgi:hypothetical protein